MLEKLRIARLARAVTRIVEGRLRSRREPARGRFDRSDVARIVARSAETYAALAEKAVLPSGRGARRNVVAGIWSLALYRALANEVGDPEYATELSSDVLWRLYLDSSRIYMAMTRLFGRDPRRRMHRVVRLGLLYPFGRPGYSWTARTNGAVLETDFHRCPVLDFFRTQDEEALEFFRRSWCSFDFPLAEALVPGGRYERAHTLSEGDSVCAMRWIAPT